MEPSARGLVLPVSLVVKPVLCLVYKRQCQLVVTIQKIIKIQVHEPNSLAMAYLYCVITALLMFLVSVDGQTTDCTAAKINNDDP